MTHHAIFTIFLHFFIFFILLALFGNRGQGFSERLYLFRYMTQDIVILVQVTQSFVISEGLFGCQARPVFGAN
ncbi:uncharacterized protein EV420DRAFT_1506361 [Desarmillaria tabescens]|uniref:Uncharacterized protein n=1 Tax=Armillaria tabescens TaxID=1929756 RepID=A0AA39NJT3_ARMTA|nr:uncharacterized protein EV420DRAFT_1506361 [Desarmillaria tabescens]KAK0466951.1 hypothetical protein EV420DRAFT_1506361 [Desarmillaria tabescens]